MAGILCHIVGLYNVKLCCL